LCHFLTKKNLCACVRQYIGLLFYIILWSEQKCVARNMVKNSKVFCIISLCSRFEGLYFLVPLQIGRGRVWYGKRLLYRCVLHSSKNCHQEYVTELHRQPKIVVAALGAVIWSFVRSCQSVQVICGLCFVLSRTRERGLETFPEAMYFWKSGFKFAFGWNKNGRVFGILSQLKKWVNLMMCMYKTFLAVHNKLLLSRKFALQKVVTLRLFING